MRILLLHEPLPPSSPARAATFLTQVVRRAEAAGHELRELMPHDTDAGKGGDQCRAIMRGRLDIEIGSFDPQIVHVHGLGVLGHLALESGAPYVVSVFAEDLSADCGDSIWGPQAQEAIENAGYVIVDLEATSHAVAARFGEVQAMAVAAGAIEPRIEGSLDWLWEVYLAVIARRSV